MCVLIVWKDKYDIMKFRGEIDIFEVLKGYIAFCILLSVG
jgi:hypothetical protein